MPPGCTVLGWTIVEGVERDEALILIQLVKHYTDGTIYLDVTAELCGEDCCDADRLDDAVVGGGSPA